MSAVRSQVKKDTIRIEKEQNRERRTENSYNHEIDQVYGCLHNAYAKSGYKSYAGQDNWTNNTVHTALKFSSQQVGKI